MKTKLLSTLCMLAALFGCNKEISIDSNTGNSNLLEKKWILSSAASGDLASIEFLPGNTFLAIMSDGSSISGIAKADNAKKQITLPGLGIIEISTLSDSTFGFGFTPAGGATTVNITGVPGPQIQGSTNTTLLCNDWKLYKGFLLNDFGNIDTVVIPQTVPYNATMTKEAHNIFSKYGTYFNWGVEILPGSLDTTYSTGTWEWANTAETRFNYVNDTDNGEVEIELLTNRELIAAEDGSRYFFRR